MNTRLIIEIIEGHHLPFSEGDKPRIRQKIYIHNGGAFPVQGLLPLNSNTDALPIGKYLLAMTAFVIGDWNSLALDKWNLRNSFIPAQPNDLK